MNADLGHKYRSLQASPDALSQTIPSVVMMTDPIVLSTMMFAAIA